MYQHSDIHGNAIDLPAGKVVCVGRNYVDHIEELNNPMPDEVVLFIKPSTSLCDFRQPLSLPEGQGECHNEVEMAVLIDSPLKQASIEQVASAIWGVAVGLELTLRDVQSKLKKQGLPWERAKAFDNACPLSGFVRAEELPNNTGVTFELKVNDKVRQRGNTKHMIWGVESLLVEVSRHFTLLPGDVVMTGTPKGVAPLYSGDRLEVSLESLIAEQTHVL